ncbi:OsmC family protein [Maliponia aquimaris]|uniref:OsmC-like protein n=1 Tax=Maliponia aquimaris TaxID=1673631 RepID=A0A238K5T9_9RHOB|nr:OsmC family protein [Maliponia aquimaris]SMX38195.1 OsmC-like protein [Maliponia aquimaris]
MSRHVGVTFSPVSGTGAGLGHTETGHAVIADRPQGKVGGTGLGLNGAELLASALGGCFWNDLHYVAAERSAAVRVVTVKAEVELAGTPMRIVRARIAARLDGPDAAACQDVFDRARETSTVANSLTGALAISFERLTSGDTK